MLLGETPHITASVFDGRLVVQGEGIYGLFQTGLPVEDSKFHDIQFYTYGLIVAQGICMRRNAPHEPLVRGEPGTIHEQLRQTIFLVPECEVEQMVAELGGPFDAPPAKGGLLPAEKLFRAAYGHQAGKVAIEACGTYADTPEKVSLTIVDRLGGYCVGSQLRPGA